MALGRLLYDDLWFDALCWMATGMPANSATQILFMHCASSRAPCAVSVQCPGFAP